MSLAGWLGVGVGGEKHGTCLQPHHLTLLPQAPDCPEDSAAAHELQKLKVRSPRAFLKVMRILHFLLLSFLVIETASLRW